MARRLVTALLVSALLLLAPASISAKEASDDRDPKPQTEADKKPGSGPSRPSIFGLVQADFYAGDSGDSGEEESTFFIRRARLGARGTLTERLSYRLMVALDGTNSDTLGGDVRTFDAYVDARLAERITLRVGQFKYTFDREGRRSAAALPLITRARVTNGLAGRLGQAGGAFRDLGVELSGQAGRWRYALGVINGNGTNRRDDNSGKDLYGRASVAAATGLDLGIGLFAGTATRAGGAESDEEIVTIDAMYERGPFAVMAALSSARYSRAGAADVEPEGLYVVGTLRVRPDVELALRYQQYDQDANRSDRSFDSLDTGITYYFAPKGRWGGLKTSLNYMARSADLSATSNVWEERGASLAGVAEDVILARLQIVF